MASRAPGGNPLAIPLYWPRTGTGRANTFDNTGEGMADRFEDLGITPALADGVESLGWEAPAGLQTDALPVIRRGNNVVLHASPGSGVVGAYGLGVLDRLANTEEAAAHPRALVLVPDDDTASRTADALARIAAPAGLTARAVGAGWSQRPVDVLVLSPTAAAAAVRDSTLKLDGITAMVVDRIDHLDATGQWDDLETIVDIIPGAAQRIIVTGRVDSRVDGFVDRHARKAMTIPPRSADAQPATGSPAVRYRILPEHDKAAAVVTLLEAVDAAEVAVVTRSRVAARSLEEALRARGIALDEEAAPRVLVLPRTDADHRSTKAAVISADVPFDADALAALHARGGAVLVTPRERDHLMRIAQRAGVTLEPLPDARPGSANAAEAVRDRVRGLLTDGDLSADLALVEPLLDAFPAAEVAAAALQLARSGHQVAPPQAERGPAGAPPPSAATTWTHLFITIGSKDGVGAGDIVGAMTGEAGLSGDQVGKIDIRETHTTVEVVTPVAEKVIDALNGRTLKGRSLRVDYDRKTRAPRDESGRRTGSGPSGPGRGGPPRGGPRRSGPGKGGPGKGGASGGSSNRGGPRRGSGGGKPPRRS